METQLKIYGYNFLEEAITDDFMEKVNEQLRKQGIQGEALKNRSLSPIYSTAVPLTYYFSEMPKVFRLSKLNLCPTLKSIQTGIPLRALDILGCGGVLFSNYQPELAEYFTDGENVIMYESIETTLAKVDYSLSKTIAQNGLSLIRMVLIWCIYTYRSHQKVVQYTDRGTGILGIYY